MTVRLRERPKGPQYCPDKALRARWTASVAESAEGPSRMCPYKAWAPPEQRHGLCWREFEALIRTRSEALSGQVFRAIGNDGERPWRREEEAL